jgi:hypothetical protein
MKSNVKRTGFDRPFHWAQVLSWVVTIEHTCIAMIVILPILSLGLQFVFGVLYMLTSIITIFFAAKVIGSDPTDRVVY